MKMSCSQDPGNMGIQLTADAFQPDDSLLSNQAKEALHIFSDWES